MADVKPKLFRIVVEGEAPTHERTELAARQHRIVIDEPAERNGTDLGATPLETLLASFLGCTNVVCNIIARELDVRIEHMKLRVTAGLDNRQIFDQAFVDVPFPEMRLEVEVHTSADDDRIDRIKTELARRCPVSQILRRAGVPIEESWTVVRP